jgi:hypothetical protein
MSHHRVLGYAIDLTTIHIWVSRLTGLPMGTCKRVGYGILRRVCAAAVIAPAFEMSCK